MEVKSLTDGYILGLITILFGTYVLFTLREKGPVLSNSYMYLYKKEEKIIYRKAEYKFVSIIFGSLTIAFSLLTLHAFTSLTWAYILSWIIILIIIIYAIIDTLKNLK